MSRNSTKSDGIPRKKRKGVHAKTKSSKLKGSKNYLKKYKGQGH